MKGRQIVALLWKDAIAHGRLIVLVQVFEVVFLAVLARARQHDAADLAFLVALPNGLMLLTWGFWLVSREKTRRTLGWLRTLPIDDSVLVGEKYLAQALCVVPFWLLTSWLFARDFFWSSGVLVEVIVVLLLLTAGALSVSGRLVFTEKGHQVLFVVIYSTPAILVLIGGKSPRMARAVLDFWAQPWAKSAIALLLAAMYLSIYLSTVAWLRRSETYRLCE